MKKTRYYLKLGKSSSTFGKTYETMIGDDIDNLPVDPKEWFKEFSWEFIKANKVKVYMDKELNQLYCYERPTKFLQQEWGQSMYSMHSPDLMIDYEKEVDLEETVTKLPSDNKYSNGMNWKNVNIKGANSRLRKPNTRSAPKPKPTKELKQELYYYPKEQNAD